MNACEQQCRRRIRPSRERGEQDVGVKNEAVQPAARRAARSLRNSRTDRTASAMTSSSSTLAAALRSCTRRIVSKPS
jgi:hypothetical protein